VYREIQTTFDGAERVADAATRLAAADDETFDALYREASGSVGSRDDDTGDTDGKESVDDTDDSGRTGDRAPRDRR
jgi:prephenate dehydrogenase